MHPSSDISTRSRIKKVVHLIDVDGTVQRYFEGSRNRVFHVLR